MIPVFRDLGSDFFAGSRHGATDREWDSPWLCEPSRPPSYGPGEIAPTGIRAALPSSDRSHRGAELE